MFGLGLPELMVVLVITILIFGPSKLPELGKGIGRAIKGFREGLSSEPDTEIKEKVDIKKTQD
ncbi:MAG: twin-arginine translocase TatA/TatE family subunit [Thermodesulfovibrionales bacterium]|nr:twin-arginine translocase TatA/TatE family subunit [Thermodesulfovibrionales bacterium]